MVSATFCVCIRLWLFASGHSPTESQGSEVISQAGWAVFQGSEGESVDGAQGLDALVAEAWAAHGLPTTGVLDWTAAETGRQDLFSAHFRANSLICLLTKNRVTL